MRLTLGSLFDGIGGWQIAAVRNGVKPIWSSEIEEYPMEVTKYHFPDTIQLGDITKIDGAKIPPVDIVCAGSPCQDLSLAGKREGLKGERSGLFRKAVDIVRQMRTATNGEYPKWFVWENVPGAFSSNKGLDFKAVLEEISEAEIPMPKSGRWAPAGMVRSRKCDICWRVLDAQYWGVPQRRKRIFLIADFREERGPEVLFEPESECRNTSESTQQGEGTAEGTERCTGETSTVIDTSNPYTMQVRCGCEGGGKGALIRENQSATLSCSNVQTLFQPQTYALDRASFNQGKNAQYDFSIQKETAQTLMAKGPGAVAVSTCQGGMAVVESKLASGKQATGSLNNV